MTLFLIEREDGKGHMSSIKKKQENLVAQKVERAIKCVFL